MKIRLLPINFLLISSCFFLSCGSVTEPDFKGIRNVRVTKFGLAESTLSLDLDYFNPNKFKVKLKRAEGDAWIENNYLGHFVMDTMIHIPANGQFNLPVKLQVDMKKILKNSLVTFFANEVVIKVVGKARVGKGFVYINYPIKYEGKQNLEELLK
jgi:LEA14-like dessication related protein